MTSSPSGTGASAQTEPARTGFLGKFTVLKGASRELWLVFLIKFLGITAYSITNKTLVLWLSSDLGFSDKHASWLVSAWGLSITITTLLVGSLTDAVGLRRTFFLGAWVCVFARAVMAMTPLPGLALICGLFPLALGEALGIPVLIAAVRRYSTTRQRSVAFSLFYMMMNVGFFTAAQFFDLFRRDLMGEHGHIALFGSSFSTYRVLLLMSLLFEISLLPILYFLRRGAEATDDGMTFTPESTRYPDKSLWTSFHLTIRDSANDTLRLFKSLLQQSGFYRLLVFLVLIGFLKILFMQIDYVFPKFGIRELGNGAPIGRLTSINYSLIIFLVPIVGTMTQRFQAYGMVVLGGAISAASVFIMALPTSWFQPLADTQSSHWLCAKLLGLHGPVHPYYVMSVLYIVMFSVGEAFYSPRVYEYAAAIAPKGQEASYGALSYVPFLLAKLVVGWSGGSLLEAYCPENGVRQSWKMWLFYALAVTVAPVGLLLLRRFIHVHEAGRED